MEFELTLTLTQNQSYYLKEFLYGIVNTIFFNRVFGQIIPSNDLFLNSVEYPLVEDDRQLNTLINEKLDLIVSSVPSLSASRISGYDSPSQSIHNFNTSNSYSNLDDSGNNNNNTVTRQHFKTSSSIKIKFYEKLQIDDDQIEKMINCWEIWNIKVIIIQQPKQQGQLLSSQSTGGVFINKLEKLDSEEQYKLIELFENNLFNIIDIIDLNKLHIPPITSFDGFPYLIEVANDELDMKNNNLNMSNSRSRSDSRLVPNNYYVQGEEILKSGFKFIKKMLSD